jgi:hypothetical protein
MSSAVKRTCKALNKRGEPCQSRALTVDGLCAIHGGLVDPQVIGRKGGSAPKMTRLRKEADDGLREQARAVLARALAGEDVPKAALDSARSLFSYRPSVPLPGEQAREQTAGKVVVLGDLIRVAIECGLVRAADGGAILVGGEVIERVDPTLPSRQKSRPRETWDPSASATNESPEEQAAELVGDAPPPEYDESTAAKLTRRYGDDRAAGYRWT